MAHKGRERNAPAILDPCGHSRGHMAPLKDPTLVLPYAVFPQSVCARDVHAEVRHRDMANTCSPIHSRRSDACDSPHHLGASRVRGCPLGCAGVDTPSEYFSSWPSIHLKLHISATRFRVNRTRPRQFAARCCRIHQQPGQQRARRRGMGRTDAGGGHFATSIAHSGSRVAPRVAGVTAWNVLLVSEIRRHAVSPAGYARHV